MGTLLHRVAVIALVIGLIGPAQAALAEEVKADKAVAKDPVETKDAATKEAATKDAAAAPAEAPKPAPEKPLTAKERLVRHSQEAYQRLKEIRETLALLDDALAGSDADKAWEHSAQLHILWNTLSSKQRLSMERRYPGTKARVEKAIADGKILARAATPKETVVKNKTGDKPAGDVALAKKEEAKKSEMPEKAKE